MCPFRQMHFIFPISWLIYRPVYLIFCRYEEHKSYFVFFRCPGAKGSNGARNIGSWARRKEGQNG